MWIKRLKKPWLLKDLQLLSLRGHAFSPETSRKTPMKSMLKDAQRVAFASDWDARRLLFLMKFMRKMESTKQSSILSFVPDVTCVRKFVHSRLSIRPHQIRSKEIINGNNKLSHHRCWWTGYGSCQ